MERKIEALKRMIALQPQRARRMERARPAWRRPPPAGWGIHAVILDLDIGPLLQVQKLLNSVRFARTKGYSAPLSAAELELMNLTGDGNGIDMVTMPQTLRAQRADREFLPAVGLRAQPGGAPHRRPWQALIADMESKMARGAQSPGARDLAAAF